MTRLLLCLALAQGMGHANPFFALCHDTHDAKKRTLDQQAELLAELGFDGVGHLWLQGLPERLKTLDEHKLKLFQVYVRVSIDPNKRAYDPALKDALTLLKGRDTMLALLVSGAKPSSVEGDARAVAILREMADLAKPFGVRLALYPHTNDWLETTEDAVRVAKKVDRENVGVMFNLCHWLKCGGDEAKLEPLLREAMPHLFTVTINGADSGLGRKGGWDRLIQPLGAGTFDNRKLLDTLKRLGYTGPIGLQCYGLGGDAREHLSKSMKAWRLMMDGLGGTLLERRASPRHPCNNRQETPRWQRSVPGGSSSGPPRRRWRARLSSRSTPMRLRRRS